MTITCSNCQHPNRDGARFCSRCRTPLQPPPAPRTMKLCPQCQAQNRLDAVTCSQCGRAFSRPAGPTSGRRRRWLWTGAAGLLLTLILVTAGALARGRLLSPENPTATPAPLAGAPTAIRPTVSPDDPLNRSLLATVQILTPDDRNPGRYSSGSGSVITDQGHLLTNYHVLVDDETGQPFSGSGQILIAVSPPDLRGEPEMAYRAELLDSDVTLDLALLRIVARADGGPLPAGFSLIAMPIGDSDTVRIGDTLTILGFPGLGGRSVTLTRGSVSGFEDGERWIKTDAEINPGNSGGAAVDEAGELVGIPTAGAVGRDPGELPGKLGLVRPVNLARPLIDRALREAR